MNEATASTPDVVVVAAAVIDRDGRYLIARRKPDAHLGGLWEFPGGKCEAGESLEACLSRELEEELGIAITQPVPFYTVRHSYPEKTVELHFFRCVIAAGEATARDCPEVRWVRPQDFPRYQFPPADIELLQKLQS
jgi:mutator protein MutT